MMTLARFFRRFRRSQSGATTIEFMIVMPLIAFWFAGTFTFFLGYSEWTRSVKATYTIADILSRQMEVDDDFIENMNTLYASMMGQRANDVWVRVSSIEKTSRGLKLQWSDASGHHFSLTENAEIPQEVIPETLVNGETVVLVESHAPFLPFQANVGISATTLTKKIAISPRFNSKVDYKN